MASFNSVTLLGNLTRDPELKTLAAGGAVANIGLAVNRRWKSSEGETKEEVTFVDCEAWGRTAELIGQYLTKGSACLIQGRLKYDTWDDKDGSRRSRLKVVVEQVQFIDRKGAHADGGADAGMEAHGSSDQEPTRPTASASVSARKPSRRPQPANIGAGGGDDEPPF